MKRCPKCESRWMSRSRLRWYERPIALVSSKRPFRCDRCRRRHWSRVQAVAARPAPAVFDAPIDFADRAVVSPETLATWRAPAPPLE